MRVRVAYISSLGTTAVLVAAALTLLTTVGAIVAFRGWPGSEGASGIQSVPLKPSVSQSRAPLVRHAPAARRTARTAPAQHRQAHVSTAGLVKTVTGRGQAVAGLVMIPMGAAPPIAAQPSSLTHAPQTALPAPGSVPSSDPAVGHRDPSPLPGSGAGLPSLPVAPPPPPDQATAVMAQLLSQGSPPPVQISVLKLR